MPLFWPETATKPPRPSPFSQSPHPASQREVSDETAKKFFGSLSGYQLLSLLMIALGAAFFLKRTIAHPRIDFGIRNRAGPAADPRQDGDILISVAPSIAHRLSNEA